MKYRQLLEQLEELTPKQLNAEILVMVWDKVKFVRVESGLFFITEFDEYDPDLETDQPYFRASFV